MRKARKSGYCYIYVSNESDNLVYFDNLTLTHERSSLIDETHYYPFGLVMAGLSGKAALTLDNKFDYNGNELQSMEFSDGSGSDVYDFNARTYDQQVGRFIQVDPLADEGKDYLWSNPEDVLKYPSQNDKTPYAAFWNNPVKYNDPDGECPRCLKALVKTAVKSVIKGKVDLGEVYDAFDAAKTIVSPETGLLDKGLAVFDLISPVSSKEVKAGINLLDGVNDVKKAKGGVYVLKDAEDKIVRTGRTKDLRKREAQHASNNETKGLLFEEKHRTDKYEEQRGLEQHEYNNNPQAKSTNGGLNKVKPISDRNKKKSTYENAARDYLKRNGGK